MTIGGIKLETKEAPGFRYAMGGRLQKAHSTWFRGDNCRFNPGVDDVRALDGVFRHVLHGWIPDEPLIGRQTGVTTFGSCFAENIYHWLVKRQFTVVNDRKGAHANTYVVRFGEGLVNTFSIRQQFEWALEGREFSEPLWYGYGAEEAAYDEQIRVNTKKLFDRSEVFIITLGLSEVWYDEKSGGVFWRAVPADRYDPERHRFRVSTVAENRENLEQIHALIRKHRPDATVIFTLSPIPLVSTFRPVSVLTANAVSKSILRAALDEFLRAAQPDDANLFYWPAYEIVTDLFADRWEPDRRHVKPPILDFVMRLFMLTWCRDAETRHGVLDAWIRARAATGTLPAGLPELLDARDEAGVVAMLGGLPAEDVALVREYAAKLSPVADPPQAE